MRKKTKDADNPLRKLRELLATAGRERISQKELAQLIGISANTIRKIEFGSRSLTDTVLTEVKVATGARWDRERRRWTQLEEKLFTHEDYTEHRRRMLNPSTMDQAIQQSTVVLIHCRIEWLFDNVPEKSREKLRSRVDYFLERCKRDFKLTTNDASFYAPGVVLRTLITPDSLRHRNRSCKSGMNAKSLRSSSVAGVPERSIRAVGPVL